jgi:methyl-accepting chemotaxis protein
MSSLSLRQRLVLLALLPALLLSIPLLTLFPGDFAAAQQEGLETKLRSVGKLVAAGTAPDVEFLGDGMAQPEDVEARLQGLASDADVRGADLYLADGSYVLGLRSNGSGALHRVDAESETPALPTLEDGREYQQAIIGQAGLVGWVVLEASLDGVRARVANQRATALLVTLVALFGGMGLAFGMASFVSRRLLEATELATRIANGDLSLDLQAHSGQDELAKMSQALHRMLEELRDLERLALAVSGGDLSVSIGGNGDLNRAFGVMLDRQRELVQAMVETSADLEVSSRQILATMRQQEAASNEQAGGVEEIRRTMSSLLEAARQIADSARGVHENAQRSKLSSEAIADRTSQLNKLTTQIAEVLIGISKIADKSDVLALNAALEGTKAGEAGKGFTLVAEEMRRLAESVMEAVRDIGELVDTIRQASQASVLATEEGVKLSLETTSSAEVIRMTSQQQQTGTEQVTGSMNEITDFLSQTLSGVRQNTGAVGELSKRASRLRELLSGYKLQGGNGSEQGR